MVRDALNYPSRVTTRRERTSRRHAAAELNRLATDDRPAHDWYRFVLSYPPHLVRDYAAKFGLGRGQTLLDPFCGTGTTVVEARKLGLDGLGIEAHPMSHFASTTKVDWTPDSRTLLANAEWIAAEAHAALMRDGIIDDDQLELACELPPRARLRRLSDEEDKLLLARSISPLPLHKTLVLRDCIDRFAEPAFRAHFRLALAKALVGPVGNLHFGPEVGVGPARNDAAVVSAWLANVRQVAADLELLRRHRSGAARVIHADSRDLPRVIAPASIDAVITSPPYPNEKDYTRTTRLESVLLGFITTKAQLKAFKQHLMRSNTRNVYKADTDDAWVKDHREIQRIAAAIEARRIELGKTSGFERLYPKVTKLYFGGMARHLAELRPALRPGARLAYVVGDQASFLRIMIRTGELLASLAEPLGYKVESIDLFRTRLSTATKEQLREEVVVLRWKGQTRHAR
ncbi:MAG: DNA methyltransferase [Opitutus sp.]|nr:DNA methyltransferase [Opitutus sp.]